MAADKVMSLIYYYASEGYPRHVQTVCNEFLKKAAHDPTLLLWRAFGIFREGSQSEALRELQVIHAPDVELAATAIMLAAHESAKVQDHEAIITLQGKVDVDSVNATEAAMLNLAAFYWQNDSRERARGIVEKVLAETPDNRTAQTLMAHVLLAQQEDEDDGLNDVSEIDDAIRYYDQVLKVDSGDIEALMGKAKAAVLKNQEQVAVQQYTEIWVKYSWYLPAMLEKCKLLMRLNDWEQVMETVGRILQMDPQNIYASALTALHSVIRDGNNKVGSRHLQDVLSALQKHEPKNADLMCKLAQPFIRLGGQDENLLPVCLGLVDRAVALRPEEPKFLNELGFTKLLQGKYDEAQEKFTAALQQDELNMVANYGLVECQILTGELSEASSQLDFLKDLAATSAHTRPGEAPEAEAYYLYLSAMLSLKVNSADAGSLVEKAIMKQVSLVANLPLDFHYYTALNPARIVALVQLVMGTLGGEPRSSTEAPQPLLTKALKAMDMVNRAVPGLSEGNLLLARLLYLDGQEEKALRKTGDVLRSNPEEYQAHLLICTIYLHQEKPQQAMSALDQALSSSFAVREAPVYAIAHSRVLMAQDKLEDAKKVLETAMNLPGVRTPITPQQRARLAKRVIEPSLSERATIFLLYSECLTKLSKTPDAPDAKKVLQDAMKEFQETPEEVRITIADCQSSIARGDVEGALKQLRNIPPTSPHFVKARMAMADIYLKHRHDKASYIKCYLALKDRQPGYDTCLTLAEALLHILEPEKAISEFEEALMYNPKDSELSMRIGKTLVMIHDYQRAADYYNKAIRNSPTNVALQHELASLLIKLKQWGQAEAVLKKCLERNKETGVEFVALDIEAWLMMAKVRRGNMDLDGYVEAQSHALELQRDMLLKMRGELPETVQPHKEKAANICYELAEHWKRMRKLEQATEMYKEGIKFYDTHLPSLQSLAKLYLGNGDPDACQQLCVTLLQADPENEEASMMLAELMFHKENYDTAIYHFQQLLEKNPGHFHALSQLVQLLRRAGRLEDIPRYLTMAEQSSPRAPSEPGFHYCKGLHSRYMANPRDALTEFNQARTDAKWGTRSIMHMVEIYLNPDNDAVWEEKEVLDSQESKEAVKAARSLLSQVKLADTQTIKYKVLDSYALMASKEKQDVEESLAKLLEMANEDPNNVPVLLAMATGFMILNQTPKARNQLKRVAKISYKPGEADDFERSWLLLADIHIQGGKYDLAQELCQKCLKYNKSCSKAWEFLGSVMEREQAFKDASENYENAWKYQNQSDPQVGYKLAFNYLKAKRLVEAIDVCHKVLKSFPDYPKIRKDILEKARAMIKP